MAQVETVMLILEVAVAGVQLVVQHNLAATVALVL
jgi:hypothetical protein